VYGQTTLCHGIRDSVMGWGTGVQTVSLMPWNGRWRKCRQSTIGLEKRAQSEISETTGWELGFYVLVKPLNRK
jgi:hypothetical protein